MKSQNRPYVFRRIGGAARFERRYFTVRTIYRLARYEHAALLWDR